MSLHAETDGRQIAKNIGLLRAASSGKVREIEASLANGADVNYADPITGT